MVEEITAYKAADGSLHSVRHDAARHDAVEELKKLAIFNHASALAIVDKAATIVPILQAVLDSRPKAKLVVDKTEGMN